MFTPTLPSSTEVTAKMDGHLRMGILLLSIFCLSIPRITLSQSSDYIESSSVGSQAGSSLNYYAYDTGAGTSCAPCSCITTDLLQVDIFCYTEDIPTGFSVDSLNFNLLGYFKYLSIYQYDVHSTLDLSAYAFRRFENETLDKLHFHEISFGLTSEQTFHRFQLKYLLIDTSTLIHGNQSFWSLISAVQALKRSLIELRVVDVHVLDQETYGPTVSLPSISGHRHLTTVEFRRVPITYLLRHTFHDLPSLQYVSFKSCPIFDASIDVFINIPMLSILQIATSKLTKLPRFLHNKNLAALQTLALTDSLINDIEDFSFLNKLSTHHGIRVLDLRGNRITSISQSACATLNSSSTRNLEGLYLWDNPFSCSCDLNPFVLWFQSSLTRIDFSGRLTSNNESNGKNISSIFGKDEHCPHGASCPIVAEEYLQSTGNLQCSDPVDFNGVSLLSLSRSLCQPELYPHTSIRDSTRLDYVKSSSYQLQRLVILSVATFATFAILLVFTFVCFKSIDRLVIKCTTRHQFDVYISHHKDNIKLVTDQFIPRLEQEPNNLKVRLNFDILQPEHTESVSESLIKSRLTIFLFDQAFLNSDKCMVDLYQACLRLSDSSRDVRNKQTGLVIIFLDKIPEDILQEHLKPLRHKITYLHWERQDEADTYNSIDESQWKRLEAVLSKLGCKPRSVQQLKYKPEDVLVDVEGQTFPGLQLPSSATGSIASSV